MSNNPYALWYKKVASTETYKNRTPEQQAEDRLWFFNKYVRPKIGDDNAIQGYRTFQLATIPTEQLYQEEDFLNLDTDSRKKVLAANIKARGQDPEDVPEGVDPAWRNIPLEQRSASSFPTSILESEYSKFQSSPSRQEGRKKALGMALASPAYKVGQAVSDLAGAEETAADFNKKLVEKERLQKQYPEVRGAETVSEVATTLVPGLGISKLTRAKQGAGAMNRFARWLSNAAGQGAVAAPMALEGQQGEYSSDRTRSTLATSAIINAGLTGAVDVAASPAASNLLWAKNSRVRSFLAGGERGAGYQLSEAMESQLPGSNVADELAASKNAPDWRVTTDQPTGPQFQGAASGNTQLAQLQASAAAPDMGVVKQTQFENPVAADVGELATRADITGIPETSKYIKTQIQPQVVSEIQAGKKAAVDTLRKANKEFADSLYKQARQEGVLGESLGVSQAQLAERAKDVLKDPRMELYLAENIPAVKSLLIKPSGTVQLTVDDAIRLQIGLAEAKGVNNAPAIDALMQVVDDAMGTANKQAVQNIRGAIAEHKALIDENIALTNAQFNAAAGVERTLIAKPLERAMANGADAASMGRTFREVADDQIDVVLQDPIKTKTLQGALAADISDALQAIKVGKDTDINLQAFAELYRDDATASKIQKVFAKDKKFLDAFNKVRKAALEFEKLGIQAGKVPSVIRKSSPNQEAYGLASVTGEVVDKRTGVGLFAIGGYIRDIHEKTRKYLVDSVTDKGKTLKIIDQAIKAQKDKTNYSRIYNEYIRPGVGQVVPKVGNETVTQGEEPATFVPLDLPDIEAAQEGLTNDSVNDTMGNDENLPDTNSGGSASAAPQSTTVSAKKKSKVDLAYDILLGKESNKQHFDRHGNVQRSNKGAIGIAQVMPGTAPEAAELAGLPWDKNKYVNDPEYNSALGKAYFTKQLQDFKGNLAHAYAAYNAGPTATKNALKKQAVTGKNWLSFMPEETIDYVQTNVKNYKVAIGETSGN